MSGIDPAADLENLGIAPRHELPGVGKNLQDHFGGLIQSMCKDWMTYHKYRNPFHLLGAIWKLYVNARGPLSVFPMNALAFLKSHPSEPRPDLEFLFLPVAADIQGNSGRYAAFNGYAITWGIMRPKSRGSVTLASSDPFAKPIIGHNYLTDPPDIDTNNRGFRIARELNAARAFDRFRGEEVDPGARCVTHEQIAAYNRKTSGTHYHPSGSCRVGVDGMAVVDPELRVHGLKGLRVADASIMPRVTSGNTNAPSIMIGEKATDLVLAG